MQAAGFSLQFRKDWLYNKVWLKSSFHFNFFQISELDLCHWALSVLQKNLLCEPFDKRNSQFLQKRWRASYKHHSPTDIFFIFVGIREEFINKMLVLDNMSKIFCPSCKQKGEKPSSVKDWKFPISSLITLQLKNLSVSSSTCMSNSISTTDVDFFSHLITQDWRFAGSSVSFLKIFYAILSG